MTPLTSFLPWVEPHVLGAPQPLVLQAIRDACIELCDRSSIVRSIEPQDVTAGEPEYEVVAPPQHRLSTVLRVTFNAQELQPVAFDEVRHGAALRAGVDTDVTSPGAAAPTAYYQTPTNSNAIYLWPVPSESATNALAISAAFAPTRTAAQVDDVLMSDHLDAVVAGALSRLMRIPDQTFSNPILASVYAAEFVSGRAAAAADARVGATRGALRVKGRAFI